MTGHVVRDATVRIFFWNILISVNIEFLIRVDLIFYTIADGVVVHSLDWFPGSVGSVLAH